MSQFLIMNLSLFSLDKQISVCVCIYMCVCMCVYIYVYIWMEIGTSQVALVVKNPPANTGDVRDAVLIPGLGRSPAGGNGNPLRYSCLENPIDRGAWQATVHGVAKSWS